MSFENASKIERWRKVGANYDFAVELVHWSETYDSSFGEGRERWNVEAYVYNEHPLFHRLRNATKMLDKVFARMPLHGGNTLLRKHRSPKTGNIVSIQFGSDYHHICDDHFTHYKAPNDELLRDAQELFDYLSQDNFDA